MRLLLALATIAVLTAQAAGEPKKRDKTVEQSSQRLVGKLFTFGGAGVVVAAVGLAYYADTRYESAFEGSMPHCGRYPDLSDKPVCDVTGYARTERARRLGTIGTITGAAGLALALTGVVLWATSPDERARTTIVPTASDNGAGVLVQGSF
jgi:hypothetical protein